MRTWLGLMAAFSLVTACGSDDEKEASDTGGNEESDTDTDACASLQFEHGTTNLASVESFSGWPTGDFSLMTWLRFDGDQDNWAAVDYHSGRFDRDNDASINYEGDKVVIGLGGEWYNVPDSSVVNDGEWHHVAVLWSSSGGLSVSVDAEELLNDPTAAYAANDGGVFVIGQEQDAPGGEFNPDQSFAGLISDVRVFDTRLSTEEVATIMQGDTTVASSNLTLHLPLDEGEGTTAADASGNGHDATISEATWLDECPPDLSCTGPACFSLEFEHGIETVATVDAFSGWPMGDFSLMTWLRFDGDQDNWGAVDYHSGRFDRDNDASITYEAGNIVIGLGGQWHTVPGSSAVNNGEWHHVALLWSSAEGMSVWVDGEELLNDAAIGYTANDGGVLALGQEQDAPGAEFNPDQSFEGLLNDVRLFDARLNAEQVQDIMRGDADVAPESLQMHLPLNDGEGSTAFDTSGNGRDATIRAATWVGECPL